MKSTILPSVRLLTMTSSKLKATDCDRYYFWMYIINIVSRSLSLPLWFGTVMHAAFEAIAVTRLKRINLIMDDASKDELSKYALVASDAEEIQLQLSIAKKMIKVYMEEFMKDIKQLDDIHTEVPFAMKLNESPVIYEGTIDAYGMKGSNVAIIERKTTSIINDVSFALLKFDVQINGYANALKHVILHKSPKLCYYVAFRKPQIRVNKNETPDDFLIRLEEDLHKRKDWYYVSFTHRFGRRSMSEVMLDIEKTTCALFDKYQMLSTSQLLDPYNWPRRRSRCLQYKACPYIILCKNCSKYQLYLRMFQQRELRYSSEHSELASKPISTQKGKTK